MIKTLKETIAELELDRPNNNIQQTEPNPKDIIKLDVPLLIRLLEYAKEDAQTDMELHELSTRLIDASSENRTLTMADYDTLITSHSPDEVLKSNRNNSVDEEREPEDTKPCDDFCSGDRVKLVPPYDGGAQGEIFVVSQCDPDRKRCWIGDKQGRGWYVNFGQIKIVRRARRV